MAKSADDEGAHLAEIERVYRNRLPEFRRVAAAILGDRDAARDAVQDGFARAVKKRASFRREGPLEAWIWRIVVNSSREHARRRSGISTEVAPIEQAVNGSGSAELETDARVHVALSLLSERQRLVLFLRYYADLDYRTIAGALDIAPGTVGVTLNTVHTKLRRLLEEVPQ